MRIPISLTVYSDLLQSYVWLDAFRQLINLSSRENDYKLRLLSGIYILEKERVPRELNQGSDEETCEGERVFSLSISIYSILLYEQFIKYQITIDQINSVGSLLPFSLCTGQQYWYRRNKAMITLATSIMF